MIFRAKFEKSHFWPPPTCQKGQQRVIQEQSSLRDLSFFRQIMAACKNSANPNGPVTRSRIKPSFFICYTLERLWPLPQPKRLRCDIVHGHLVIRCFPARQVFGRLRAGLFVLVSRFVYIKNYLAAPFGLCHNLTSSSNHLELKFIRLWNHIVQQRVTTLLDELGTRVFWGTPHTCPNWKKVIKLKVYKFKN